MSKTLKRKRINEKSAVDKRLKTKGTKKSAPRTVARLDGLRWKEATLPDRLEDAEGFYGLEEVDDVEVVKDASTGQITFQVRGDEADGGDDDWSGFEDELETSKGNEGDVLIQSKPTKSNKTVTDQNVTKPAKTKKAKSTPAQESNIDAEVDFNALEDLAEDRSADITAWKELDLSHDLLTAISALGFSDPTPIQTSAIPPILAGHDVIGKAVTGSGKTLAFAIPIVERWLSDKKLPSQPDSPSPMAFMLAPTRELAHQLSKHIEALCKNLEQSPRIATVTGGLSVIKQQRQLETADIIIGTPGRLWEVINGSYGLVDRLRQIRFLVIDEADRLLSEGHFKEVEEILDVLDRKVIGEDEVSKKQQQDPVQRQTLVFSATFHKGLQQKLAGKQKWRPNESNLLSNTQSLDYLLHKLKFQPRVKPTFVDANPTSQMAKNLSESILECGTMQRDLYLYALLLWQQHEHAKKVRLTKPASARESLTRTLIFTNSISAVKRLSPLLTSLQIPQTAILPLHSSMPQKSRLRSLERFNEPLDKSCTTAILIATDVAARGLDIKGIDTIIHYHVPRTADAYVHRSGRTARSTNSGRSILLCSPEEVVSVTRLISKIHADRNGNGNSNDNDNDNDNDKPSQPGPSSSKAKPVQPVYLPASLPTQLSHRVSLAQKITDATLDTSKTNSESNFLRSAAEDLGVDYSSDEFDLTATRTRRGRGGGKDKKRKENVRDKQEGKVEGWKAELRNELKGTGRKRIDFGDGEAMRGKFLAGGGVDVEHLLKTRG